MTKLLNTMDTEAVPYSPIALLTVGTDGKISDILPNCECRPTSESTAFQYCRPTGDGQFVPVNSTDLGGYTHWVYMDSLSDALRRGDDVPVRVRSVNPYPLPQYETIGSAGFDVRSNAETVIPPHSRVLVPTGLFLELPFGYEAQVRPRSGLALKHGITVLNTPGTIDSDYRGEVGVILMNHSDTEFPVKVGDRVAQIVIARHERARLVPAENLSETLRGEGGFGHTGTR